MGGRTWRKQQSRYNKEKKEQEERRVQELEWALLQRLDSHFLQAIWSAPADVHLRQATTRGQGRRHRSFS
jgi:hypothetical protein